MKKPIFFFMAVLVLTIPWAGKAYSAAQIREVNVEGSEVAPNQTIVLRRNMADLYVDAVDAVQVKIGSVTQSVYQVQSDDDYRFSFPDFSLGAGQNGLTVQVTGTDGTSVKQSFKINCILSFVEDTTYFSEIPVSGKLRIFDQAVNLNFPKDVLVLDEDGDMTDSQKIEFRVRSLEPDDYPSRFRTVVSKLLDVSPDGSEGETLSASGSISIKYDENVPDFSANTITMMYKAEGSSEWINLGAAVDSRNRTALAAFRGFGVYGVFNGSRFFSDYNWAKLYAEPLWAKGIMQIRDDTGDIIFEDFDEDTSELGLNLDCTRADFASMMVRALGQLPVNYPGSSASRFTDLDGLDSDDKRDIETAAAYGIIEGVDVDRFNPRGSLTRAQAAVILARAMKLSLVMDEEKVETELKKVFSGEDDYATIPDWARPGVLAVVKGKYMNGIPGGDGSVEFQGSGRLTRAQGAKLVYLVMKAKKRI